MALIGEDDRLKRANELIAVIASCGRQFFRTKDRVAKLEVDRNGRVWFIDDRRGERVFTHYKGYWRKFSNGGTLRTLIEHLRDFVKLDRPVPNWTFGPWRKWISDRDIWGYGEDMEQVRSAALGLGIMTT